MDHVVPTAQGPRSATTDGQNGTGINRRLCMGRERQLQPRMRIIVPPIRARRRTSAGQDSRHHGRQEGGQEFFAMRTSSLYRPVYNLSTPATELELYGRLSNGMMDGFELQQCVVQLKRAARVFVSGSGVSH